MGITDEPQQIPTPTGRAPHGAAASYPSGAQAAPYSVNTPQATAPTAPTGQPLLHYLESGPAYLTHPGMTPGTQPGAQPMAPTPFIRPTPPMGPTGNLFQGLGGIPGG